MRGVKRPGKSEDDISSYYECDRAKIQKIKVAMLDAYDLLVEYDRKHDKRESARGRPLAPPSLRRILAQIPFWVNERLACEVRRQLIADGEITDVRASNPRAAENGGKKAGPFVSLEEIDEAKRLIVEKNQLASRDPHKRAHKLNLDRATPKEVADWARKRYNAAWQAIQYLHLKAATARLNASVQSLNLPFVTPQEEVFGDSAEAC